MLFLLFKKKIIYPYLKLNNYTIFEFQKINKIKKSSSTNKTFIDLKDKQKKMKL